MNNILTTLNGLDFKTKALVTFGGLIVVLSIKDSLDKYWESTLNSNLEGTEKKAVLERLSGTFESFLTGRFIPTKEYIVG